MNSNVDTHSRQYSDWLDLPMFFDYHVFLITFSVSLFLGRGSANAGDNQLYRNQDISEWAHWSEENFPESGDRTTGGSHNGIFSQEISEDLGLFFIIQQLVPVFWRFVLPAQIVLPPIKQIGSTNRWRKMIPSDCATSILFIWFEAFSSAHTYPYPKPTRPYIPLP